MLRPAKHAAFRAQVQTAAPRAQVQTAAHAALRAQQAYSTASLLAKALFTASSDILHNSYDSILRLHKLASDLWRRAIAGTHVFAI